MSEQVQILLRRRRLEWNSTERSKSILDSPKSVLYVLRRKPSLDDTYIYKLYLSSDFSVAYIASISDPN